MGEQCVQRGLLLRIRGGREPELVGRTGVPLVGEFDFASGLDDELV